MPFASEASLRSAQAMLAPYTYLERSTAFYILEPAGSNRAASAAPFCGPSADGERVGQVPQAPLLRSVLHSGLCLRLLPDALPVR